VRGGGGPRPFVVQGGAGGFGPVQGQAVSCVEYPIADGARLGPHEEVVARSAEIALEGNPVSRRGSSSPAVGQRADQQLATPPSSFMAETPFDERKSAAENGYANRTSAMKKKFAAIKGAPSRFPPPTVSGAGPRSAASSSRSRIAAGQGYEAVGQGTMPS